MAWVLHEVLPTTAPAEPVTLSDMKLALRVPHSLDDYFLSEAISAAREYLEVEIEESLIPRSYQWISDTASIDAELCLPAWPVTAVSAITYYDASNVLQTFATANYQVDLLSRPARVRLVEGASWPTVYARYDALKIAFTSGYSATTRFIPERTQQLLRLLVADLYEHREANIDARLQENQAYKRMLWATKRVTFT